MRQAPNSRSFHEGQFWRQFLAYLIWIRTGLFAAERFPNFFLVSNEQHLIDPAGTVQRVLQFYGVNVAARTVKEGIRLVPGIAGPPPLTPGKQSHHKSFRELAPPEVQANAACLFQTLVPALYIARYFPSEAPVARWTCLAAVPAPVQDQLLPLCNRTALFLWENIEWEAWCRTRSA